MPATFFLSQISIKDHSIEHAQNGENKIERIGRWQKGKITYLVCLNENEQLYTTKSLNWRQFAVRKLFRRYKETHSRTLWNHLRASHVVTGECPRRHPGLLDKIQAMKPWLSETRESLSRHLIKAKIASEIQNCRMRRGNSIGLLAKNAELNAPPLITAVLKEDIEEVKKESNPRQSVTFNKEPMPYSPLHLAIALGNVAICNELLNKECERDLLDQAIEWAAILHQFSCFTLLVEKRIAKARENQVEWGWAKSPSLLAVVSHHSFSQAVHYLIVEKKILDLHGYMLFTEYRGESALIAAIRNNLPSVVQLLIDQSVQIINLESVLTTIRYGNQQLLHLLLTQGIGLSDEDGDAILLAAVKTGIPAIVDVVLEKGMTGVKIRTQIQDTIETLDSDRNKEILRAKFPKPNL